jgi:CHAT domain-containing protein
LIAPIADRVRNARLICIVPHGPLHYVPFHALHPDISDASNPLFEACPVLYAPSATVLLDYCWRKQPSQQHNGLCVAYAGSATDGQAPLRFAELESHAVAERLGSMLVTGAAARKDLIKEEGPRHRFLHFSCHGHFSPGFPLTSGLELADGRLDVRDILDRVQLDADLVTLSSCNTGQSALRRGDELIGLVRAFMYAGTPSVLVSLWKVDDVSTAMLMDRFYCELAIEGVTKAVALQQAQRYLAACTDADIREWLAGRGVDRPTAYGEIVRLRQAAGIKTPAHGDRLFSHPFYWAPFCLIGDRLITGGPL